MKSQRLILDIVMILLVLQMLYLLIGEAYHEWTGILLILMFAIHNAQSTGSGTKLFQRGNTEEGG